MMTIKSLSQAMRYDNFPGSVDIQIIKPGHIECVTLLKKKTEKSEDITEC